MQPITVLAFVLLTAVALAPASYVALAPDALPVYLGPAAAGSAPGGAVAKPNPEPQTVGLVQPATAAPLSAAETATPNHDPRRVSRMQPPAAETPTFAPPISESAATPNHDPHRVGALPSFATLLAEPEPAPPAPAFVDTDTRLYARDSARLRAAPRTTAQVLAKLAIDTPLHAVARSTDRAWLRVALDDGRIGYVHRTAVTQYRLAKTKRPAAPAPAVAAAPPQQVSESRSQGLLGYVDQTVNWFTDTASRGSTPTIVRTER